MRQLMQKNVFQLCRMTRYVCPQQDSVNAVFFADEGRGVKVKIAVLCIAVFQPVREILLAELLKDFLLVFRSLSSPSNLSENSIMSPPSKIPIKIFK